MRLRAMPLRLVLVTVLFTVLIGCQRPEQRPVLRILTYDIYALGDEVMSRFTEKSGYQVELIKVNDAGSVLNRALQTKDASLTDLIIGIDSSFLQVAIDHGLFQPYTGSAGRRLRPEVTAAYTGRTAMPFDFGWVGLNYDTRYADGTQVPVPTSLWDLCTPAWRGKVVVQNPRTSSPGRIFLAATVDYFRNDADETTDYRDWWRAMAANQVIVTDGWTEAYVIHYSGGYGQTERGHVGDAHAVVSYLHSPGAEAFWGDGTSTSAALDLDRSSLLQVEYAGIAAGARNVEAAASFIDYLLSEEVQRSIPESNVMYPAITGLGLPEGPFQERSVVPAMPAQITTAEIGASMERWLDAWDAAMAQGTRGAAGKYLRREGRKKVMAVRSDAKPLTAGVSVDTSRVGGERMPCRRDFIADRSRMGLSGSASS